jgi:hypothetical protein
MAIIFPNKTISQTNNRIDIPGSVIQFVDNQQTISTTASTSAWVDVLTTAITTSKDSNKILVEYMMNHRIDYSQGTWNLGYHRILCNGTQVMYSGHMGAAALWIGYYERTFLYDATTQGTYTFTASCLPYNGTLWIGSYNSGSTSHYLRLYEIAT